MDDAGDGPGTANDAGERGSRIAIAGLVFAALFVVGWLLLRRGPALDDPAEEIIDFYSDPGQRRGSLIAALYVVPFGAIAFIWFTAALRDRFVRSGGREHTVLSTAHLISGTLFAAALFTVAAVELTVVWLAENATEDQIDVATAKTMIAFGDAMAHILAARAGAVFIAVSTTRAMRSGLFPRWYGITSLVIAVMLLLVFAVWAPVALLVPFWVAATSGLILAQRSTRQLADGA